MKIKTHELLGAGLDWAVAKVEGKPIVHDPMGFKIGSEAGYWIWDKTPKGLMTKIGRGYTPSTDRDQGFEIVEREGIAIRKHTKTGNWYAMTSADLGNDTTARWEEMTARGGERYGVESWAIHKRRQRFIGETPLIAAMRCFVASKLGAEVDVPDELVGGQQ